LKSTSYEAPRYEPCMCCFQSSSLSVSLSLNTQASQPYLIVHVAVMLHVPIFVSRNFPDSLFTQQHIILCNNVSQRFPHGVNTAQCSISGHTNSCMVVVICEHVCIYAYKNCVHIIIYSSYNNLTDCFRNG